MKLTEELSKEYRTLYQKMIYSYNIYITNHDVNKIIKKILNNKLRYVNVEMETDVPWYVVACLHAMESNCNFEKHLHNGDSLLNKTVNHPSDRPESNPPFTWVESAIDAIEYKGLDKWYDWTIEGVLFKIEGYNGFGYRMYHSHVKSPYLWSGTNHYTCGKYIADGKWSETAVSKQIGAAIILRELIKTEQVNDHESEIWASNERLNFKTGRIITLIFIILFILFIVFGFYIKE